MGASTRRFLHATCLAPFILALVVAVSGCAPPRIVLPQGSGVPLLDYDDVFDTAFDRCRRVRTIELMLTITGRTGDVKLRGRVRGALARPASLRLEGLAPFGAPGFVLVAGPDTAVLVLPRERRVVTDARGSDLLEVLAGVPLGPADFRAVLTGCLVPEPRPRAARTYRNGWVGIELEGDATVYLRTVEGQPVIVAGTRRGLTVEYLDHTRGLPRQVRVQTTGLGTVATDFTATLSQVSINVDLDPRAFVPQVREDFVPMTIDELRGTVGPLEDRTQPSATP